MTMSPLVVVSLALNVSGALAVNFDGSRRSGWTVEARGPEGLGVAGVTLAALAAWATLDVAFEVEVGSGSGLPHPARASAPRRAERIVAFMAPSHSTAARAESYLAPKIRSPAVEMMAFRMMMASDEFTTARVVAQPTPSLPPNVDRPQ